MTGLLNEQSHKKTANKRVLLKTNVDLRKPYKLSICSWSILNLAVKVAQFLRLRY